MSYLLEMKSITKAFGAVKAVDNVSLRLNPGEVMSLCGENGSGKSTLMKVLCGIYPHGSYEGEIVFAGEVLQATHIRDTERKGIAIIHQELALVKHLTVLENIFLGAELSRHGVLDYDTMTLRCEKLLAQVSLAISPDTRVGDLGLGQQQLVEIAKAEGADAICHGCTGKGNDQVRFELAIMHFAPEMKIITPWREWDIQSRNEEIDYAEAHHIPLKINRETNYSKDKNLWHLSHEGLDLEDPGNEPQYEKEGFLEMSVSPLKAPDTPTYVELDFEKGVPVKLNGKAMKSSDIISKLNEIGGCNGIGLYDVVENRLVGMKSRGVYETPGGTILYRAHEILETLTLDKKTAHKKKELSICFGELVYDGQWFSPLRKALSAFVTETQQTVTGKVRLKLYKGNIINSGVWSPYSLYSEDIVTFNEGEGYQQSDATGFIRLLGLPTRIQASVNARNRREAEKC